MSDLPKAIREALQMVQEFQNKHGKVAMDALVAAIAVQDRHNDRTVRGLR